MSSILVYSGFNGGCITSDTPLKAANFYGDSKIKAEEKLEALDKGDMKICVLRPPMIYGKGSKGNYPSLAKLAGKVPFFPATHNKRSMLYIENLCEFCRLLIENEDEGVFFPQNKDYSDTAELIATIGEVKGKKVLVRCDFNVPQDQNGKITDNRRIVSALDTINYLLENNSKIILCSHLGRPKGEFNLKYSLNILLTFR